MTDTTKPRAATLGILMLDTRFPRISGDLGNPSTLPFPVLYKTVGGASPARVIGDGADGLLARFIDAGRRLVAGGADGVTTTCGFLSVFQDELAAALTVPVAASSLMQVPVVERMLPPGKRCGILTIAAADLTGEHLERAGCRADTPVGGTDPDGEFSRNILQNETDFDADLARRENIAAAAALATDHPAVGTIVLECTNMIPYAADIRDATALPVFSMYSFACWFQQGLSPRRDF